MLKTDEATLICRAANGNERAFETLYRAHHPRIYATLVGRTRNRNDAEDLAQVTFMRAYRGLSGFRGEAAFSTWLTQIALNVCMTHLRAVQVRRSWHGAIEALGSEYREVWEPAGHERPDEALHRKECLDLLMSGIEGLPVPYRKAAWMRYMQDRSYSEIVQKLQAPMETVKTWLYRARQRLQDAFQRSGGWEM